MCPYLGKLAVVIPGIKNNGFVGAGHFAHNLRLRVRTGLAVPRVRIAGIEITQVKPPLASDM